jgi:pimeloyl-ACP methyl ester carboxylesterase
MDNPPVAEPAGVTHETFQTSRLRMHLARAGDPQHPPLLMLHGWPQSWFAFRHLIADLQRDHHVIAPDLRGWGETEAPADPGGYRKREMALDLLALLDALGIGQVDLIGHDWGSLLGFLIALQRPRLVRRYLVLGGFHPWPKRKPAAVTASRRFWYQAIVATPVLGPRAVADPRFIRLLYRAWAAPGARNLWSDAELEQLTGHLRQPVRARASSFVYRQWLTRELPAVISGRYAPATLELPILFLHGEQDGCIDAVFAGRSRRLPNARIELLPGVGHFPAEEVPELVLERARAFFA